MGESILKPLVLMLGGSSLTAGRFCNPPLPWTYFLREDMLGDAACLGPVVIINTGKGSQTSNFGASQAALMAPLRPTHVLMGDFGINDCAIGPVSIPQATINFNAMVASYRTENPDVIICHQTMSSAAATDANRVNLATYYDNGLANAILNGLESLDNYYGTALVPGGWPKPLPNGLTVGAAVGFSAWGGTWNPADKAAGITLSGSNLTATNSGASNDSGVRGTVSFSTGLHYFEVTVVDDSGLAVGILLSGSSLGVQIGTSAGGCGIDTAGQVFSGGGAPVASLGASVAGDVLGVAVNFTAGKVYWRRNGLWLNGDPTTTGTTGGTTFAPGTYFSALTADPTGAGTANFATLGGDNLHPLWASAFQTYSYPNILAWAKRMMADFW